MTVYSINQRVYDQTSMSGATSKTQGSSADEFLSALNQAASQVSGGAAATPSAEQALQKVFDRPTTDDRSQPKAADKPKRAEAKDAQRADKPDRSTDAKDEPVATSDVKAKDTAPREEDEPAPEAKAEQPADDQGDDVTLQVADEAPVVIEPEAVAAVVPVQQQVVQVTQTAGQVQAAQAVQDDGAEKLADDPGIKPQDMAALQQANADQDAEAPVFDPTQDAATQQAAKGKGHAQDAKADALQDQADALAASLDDTGAQLSVQVKVSNANASVQPTTGTAEVLLTQDVDGIDLAPEPQTNGGQTGTQAQANAGQAAQGAAAGQDPAQLNKAVDARPFVAVLAQAQAEAANQPQGAQGSSGNQTQAIAGLGGPGGTQAASKTSQAQAAQAPRQQNLPQAKEVMDQVKVQIAKQGANGDTIKVQLKPVELGSIEVKLDVAKDGSVSGVVTADNKETLAMLKNDSRSLEKALSDAGFKTDAGSLSFNLRGDGQQQASEQQTSSRRSRRAALAAAGGLDATQAGMAAQAQSRYAGARSGVDIQV